MNDELYHHGIKGMKWGVRRTPAQLGHKISSGKKRVSQLLGLNKKSKKKARSSAESSTSKKKVSEMSDTELREKINRLQMEKTYKELNATLNPQRKSKAKAFVSSVMEQSAKNIATQTTTYLIGSAINNTIGVAVGDKNMVNPKKGQKDK